MATTRARHGQIAGPLEGRGAARDDEIRRRRAHPRGEGGVGKISGPSPRGPTRVMATADEGLPIRQPHPTTSKGQAGPVRLAAMRETMRPLIKAQSAVHLEMMSNTIADTLPSRSPNDGNAVILPPRTMRGRRT